MSTKKFLVFGKMLALLLLISFSAEARTSIAIDKFREQEKEILDKAEKSFHRNMLQPQVAEVSSMSENSIKPLSSGYISLFGGEKTSLLLKSTGQTNVILQDANRCESVSKLLFPFHYFW